ncbi:MAG: hypothetical protein ACKO6K_08255, partial [Chitinophagaceae bacterium]
MTAQKKPAAPPPTTTKRFEDFILSFISDGQNNPELVYFILKYFIRTGLHWFCRRIVVNDPAVLRSKGPFLLACNHPNSFLDAVILDTLFDEPI